MCNTMLLVGTNSLPSPIRQEKTQLSKQEKEKNKLEIFPKFSRSFHSIPEYLFDIFLQHSKTTSAGYQLHILVTHSKRQICEKEKQSQIQVANKRTVKKKQGA